MALRKLSFDFSRKQKFISPAESTVKPYEVEFSFFFVVILTGVYIAYDLIAIPSGGHPFGNWLGIIGALLMLMTEILYSVRKRTTLFNWAGPVRYWLSLHIFTGIIGPFLILMHTGLQFRGLAGISFLLTMVVVGSGFIGRYLYTALPRTISGVATSAQELDREVATMTEMLNRFQEQKSEREREILTALQQRTTRRSPLLTLLGRNYYQRRYEHKLKNDLKQIRQLGEKQRKMLTRLLAQKRERQRQREMLETARRLLRIWHILHIPFGLTLFFSMFIHIFATIYFRAGIFH